MAQVSPFGALLRGIAAGAVGSAAQTAFFKLTSGIAPKPPEDAFEPPEKEQRDEGETETVARRAAEFAQHAPLDEHQKQLGGQLVHYGFGAAWGGLYGLARESAPFMANPIGMAAFGVGVWAVSDNAILPLLKLAGPPTHYPAKSHAFAIAAHLVYGAAVGLTYALLRPRTLAAAGATLWFANARRKVGHVLPREVRPLATSFLTGVAKGLAARPVFAGAMEEVLHEVH